MSALIVPATQALRYIASGEEESKIILLKSVGLPDPGKQADKEVALECLMLLKKIQDDFQPNIEETVEPEEVQLKDGDEIVFSRDFDVLFHQCCSCQKLHSVSLSWQDDGSLSTRWTQVDSMPTEEEVLSSGAKVVKLADL